MVAMLPLDRLTKEAKLGFASHGVDIDSIIVAVQLDMDTNGRFGETWLCIDANKKMHLMSATGDKKDKEINIRKNPKKPQRIRKKDDGEEHSAVSAESFENGVFKTFDLADMQENRLESLVNSQRLIAKLDGVSTVIAHSTHSRKQKIFVFLELSSRIYNGTEVTETDQIFDQFNVKCPKCGKLYDDQRHKICSTCVNRKPPVVRLLKYLRPHIPGCIIVIVSTLTMAGLSLVSPLISTLFLYDNVISETGKYHHMGVKMVWLAVGLIVALSILSTLINIIRSISENNLGNHISWAVSKDLFAAIQKLSLSYLTDKSTGELYSRVGDAWSISGFFTTHLPTAITHVLNYIGLTIICFSLNWRLTLIVYTPVPIIIYMFKRVVPRLRRMYTKVYKTNAAVNASLNDSLGGVRVVKAFAKEAEETHRFHSVSHKAYEANLEVNLISLTIFPLIGLLCGLSANAIWGFGGIQVLNQEMTYGEFAAFWSYIGMIFAPLNYFTQFIDYFTNVSNTASRMFETLDEIPAIQDGPNAVDMDTTMRGDITLENVDFQYTLARPILKDVNMNIHAGDQIGLVGHTGCGKTTIINLILRLYDVNDGRILIDGVNVKDIKVSSLRKNMAVVSQEIYLFRGTIADNIRYAKPDATLDEVIAAAKIANAHDFILSLPDGYDAIVGTGARSLSGGQRQRISIARAVLMNPRILVLDEATAAMDTITERLIQDALYKIIEGRTSITIAHRLATLKNCNYLYVIEGGMIAEHGTHTELLDKKGIYHKLYTIQTEAMSKVLQDA